MTWSTPTERTLMLSGLRPLLLGALLLGAEPIPLLGIAIIESIVIGTALAAATPYARSTTPPEDTHTDLDGFAASWPRRSGVGEELAGNIGISSGLWAGLGAVPVFFIGIPAAARLEPDPLVLLFFSAVLAVPVAITQLSATWAARHAANTRRRSDTLQIDQSGRTLAVGPQRWLRHHDDEISREPGLVRIRRGGEALEIPGGEGCLDWLVARLDETRPPPDDAPVPEQLQALRQSPQRSNT